MGTEQKHEIQSYFTVDFGLILLDKPIPYSLYVNSSKHEHRDRFVKIVGAGEVLNAELVEGFKKYHRVYILETERSLYLQSLIDATHAPDIERVAVIKDSAIRHLDDIFSPDREFNTEVLGEAIQGCHDSMQSMVGVIKDYDINNLKKLIGDLSFHDFYTYDHSINVSMYTVLIYKSFKPSAKEEDLVTAGLGGLLHDLGKIKIPTEILNNTDKLTDEEFAIIKTHPGLGAKLFEETAPELPGVNADAIKRVILEHHENWDGSGYPNGLKGKEHHLFSRICSIADFFDAVTTKRSYSDVMSVEDALVVMERTVGKKLDPEIFKFFTEKVSKAVLNGKAAIELPEDFDTERAHKVLPLRKVKPKKISSDFTKAEDPKKKKAA
jgi:HD-GYP domain-containing protein (c-di-GMP phosphodiesterase class II)